MEAGDDDNLPVVMFLNHPCCWLTDRQQRKLQN